MRTKKPKAPADLTPEPFVPEPVVPKTNAELTKPLIGQRTFLELDIMESEDDRPGFVKAHDLIEFSTEDSARHALEFVSYSSERKSIAATNGHVAIVVPMDGRDMPDAMIHAETLHDAIADADGQTVYIDDTVAGQMHVGVPGLVTRNAPVPETKFPDLYGIDLLHKRWRPDSEVSLAVKELEHIVKYAKSNKAQSVTFGMRLMGSDGIKAQVDTGVRFTFHGGDEFIEGAVGFIMPMAANS